MESWGNGMLQLCRFCSDEEGATALEYGLLAALIAAVIIASVVNLGTSISNAFTSIHEAMLAVLNS